MIKKVLITGLLFSFPFICYAVTLDGSTMLDEDVQLTFKTIRTQIVEHDEAQEVLTEIYTNRMDRNYEVAGEMIEFTPEEAQKIVEGEIPKGFSEKIGGSLGIFGYIHSAFQSRFSFEKDIWDFEQDLLRDLQILPRYINETDSDSIDLVCDKKNKTKKPKTDCDKGSVQEGLEFVCAEEQEYENDCNTDRIRDWDFIDKILFGKYYYKTDAQFTQKTKAFSEKEDPNGKKWQIGDPRQELNNTEELKTKDSKVYERDLYKSPNDPSIAAQLDAIKQSLSAKWGHSGLNGKTGLGEVIATRFFEPAFLEPTLDISRPIDPYIIPQKKLLKAEKYEVDLMTKEDVRDVFKGIEIELLDRSPCEEIVIPDPGGESFAVRMTVEECEFLRSLDYDRTLESLIKTGNLNPHELNGFRANETLTLMDDHFWTLYLSTQRMEKLLTTISEKTVCKSKSQCQ